MSFNVVRTIVVFARGCRSRVNNMPVTDNVRVLVLDIDRNYNPHDLIGRRFSHVEYDGVTPDEVRERWPQVVEQIERGMIQQATGLRRTYVPTTDELGTLMANSTMMG